MADGSIPSVTISITDGGLGIAPPTTGDILAIVGPTSGSSSLDNVPKRYTKLSDVKTDHVRGPVVELAAYELEVLGKQIVIVKTTTTTPGSFGSIDNTGMVGTALPAIASTPLPDDEYEPYLIFPTGGTLGTTGIKYKWSISKGRDLSAEIELGTATSITIPGTGGIKFNLEPPTAQVTALVTYANLIRTKILAHFPYITGTVHTGADNDSDDNVQAAATDLPTVLTLLPTMLAALVLHFARGTGTHLTANGDDTTSLVAATAAVAAATASGTAQDAITACIAIEAAYEVHLANTTEHTIADAVNVVAGTVPTRGTIVANDVTKIRCVAPAPTNAELLAALTALGNSNLTWGGVHITTPMTSTFVTTADTWLKTTIAAKGKFRWGVGNFRRPNIGESEATYLAAYKTALDASTSAYLGVGGGYGKHLSSVTGFTMARPVSWGAAVRAVEVDASTDLAQIEQLGPIPRFTLRDDNQNPDPDFHDEENDPGLDAARAITLRSVEGYQGVYITNPNLLVATDSDFELLQYRRVMNIFCTVVLKELKRRLSKKVRLDRKTGFILEQEAKEIEAAVLAALRAALLKAPHASNVTFVLSRTDNILSTKTITCTGRCQPLGYPKFFVVDLGLVNPALQTALV